MVTPLEIWQKKKLYFEKELAIASDASQKFALREQIKECEQEIAKLQSQGSQSNEANITTTNPINSTQNGQATKPTSGQEQPIIAFRQGAISTMTVAFILINELKQAGGLESVELLAKLHLSIKSIINAQQYKGVQVLSSLLGAIILLPDSLQLDTINLIISINKEMNALGIPIRVGMSRGDIQELIDVDGKSNFIGVAINHSARLATTNLVKHPGLLVHDSLANHLQSSLRATHWLSTRNSNRLFIEVAGKRNEKFICYYPPEAIWSTTAKITYQYDESFQPITNNAAIISYDLPNFSDGDLNQLSQRFRAITDVFLALVAETKLSLKYFYFSPGGDGGIMVFTDLEKKPVYDLAKNFAEKLAIESQNRSSLISAECRIGLHYGIILLYENAEGDLRPTGEDIFIADSITFDEEAKKAAQLIFTEPFKNTVSGGSNQHFTDNFHSLLSLTMFSREIKRYRNSQITLKQEVVAKFKYLVKFIVCALILVTINISVYSVWIRTDSYQINYIIADASKVLASSEVKTVEGYHKALVISERLNEALLSANKISDLNNKIDIYTSIAEQLAKLGKTSEAKDFLDKVLNTINKISDPGLQSKAYISVIPQLVDLGIITKANDSLDKALAATNKMVEPHDDPITTTTWPKNYAYSLIVKELAKLHRFDEASVIADNIIEKPSKSIIKPYLKNKSYILIAEELAKCGRFDEALLFISKIDDPYFSSTACISIASQLADSGKTIEANLFLDKSLFFADNILEAPSNKIYLYLLLASKLIILGKIDEATILVDKALFFFNKLDPKNLFSFSSPVAQLVRLGKINQIATIADNISDPRLKASIYSSIAEELARLGKIDEALLFTDKIPKPYSKYNAYTVIIKELTKSGKTNEALDFVGKTDALFKDDIYRLVAEELAKAGKINEALAIMSKIPNPTDKISDNTVNTYNLIARQLTKANPTEPLINYINSVQKLITNLTKDENRSRILASIAITQAKLGQFYQARITAEQTNSSYKLSSEDKLTVYTAILREYTIKQKPSLAKAFEEKQDNSSN